MLSNQTTELLHSAIANHGDPGAWKVLADAVEEDGHPAIAGMFRRKYRYGYPAYLSTLPGAIHSYGRAWSVEAGGEPVATHLKYSDALEHLEDLRMRQDARPEDIHEHIVDHGAEIAPGIHVVHDGDFFHLHDLRRPGPYDPVVSFPRSHSRERLDLARSSFQGFDRDTEALLPHAKDEFTRGVIADRLEEAGDPLHHVFRVPDARPEFDRRSRDVHHDLQYYPIRKRKNLGDLHIVLYHSPEDNHVIIEAATGHRKTGTRRYTMGAVTPEQAKEIIAYHYNGRGKMPRRRTYNIIGQLGYRPIKLARRPLPKDLTKPSSKRAQITGLTAGGSCEHCGKKDVALIHVRGENSGKEVKLGTTCASNLCHTVTGEKLHRERLVRHGHSMNLLKKEGHEPVYPTIMYDSERLDLARHVSELAHEFNPEKSPKAFADALLAVGHPLSSFVRRAQPGLPLLVTSQGRKFAKLPGERGFRETHVPRVRHLEAPELGLNRVGFHYDPTTGAGHIVVAMETSDPTGKREITWHATATKQELKDLGAKNRRMKLARLIEETTKHGDGATVYDIKHPSGAWVSITHIPRRSEIAVNNIEVPKAKRKQGIGRELIDHVKAKAKELGVKRITTVKIMPGAEGFAGKMGFNVDDKLPQVKLARPNVIADSLSRQQGVRKRLAARIALQAGLKLQELQDARTQDQAGVLQTYGHDNEPDAIDYAAAWYGLLTRAPRLSTFHVHEGGPDTYHTWKTSLNPDRVLAAATGLGLNAVVTSAGDVAILDRGNAADAPITTLKEATYATAPRRETGTAKPFGGRDDYRATIRGYEQSVFGNRPSAPPGAGTNPAAA